MARVTGIGGLFFRSRDPKMLSAWYSEMLAIPDGGLELWSQDAGPTAFSPFRADSDYFSANKQFMLNLRVDDLETMTNTLEENDLVVETPPE